MGCGKCGKPVGDVYHPTDWKCLLCETTNPKSSMTCSGCGFTMLSPGTSGRKKVDDTLPIATSSD